ncbi:MAG: hypothetical protein C7B43_00690 [Sulfobacillus benefaciens]|uniref:DUF2953 domain-containing protein n=1 Tax=Sulfobacillus benefaciens TaxID=453960 RepID=A0A2T2XBA0_9FIRM|nr:MAG: hypothetical protein C7B43_00690 [Sulfobacillus benefaciens]
MVIPIILLIISCLGLVGLIVLFALPITTTILVSGQGSRWTMACGAHILGMTKNWSWQVPMTPAQKVKSTTGIDPRRIGQGILAVKIYRDFIMALWSRTSVTQFSCVLYLGLEEAATTAIVTGLLNNLLGPWVALHIAPNSSNPPMFGIYPLWGRVQVEGELTATWRFRVIGLLQAVTAVLLRVVYLVIRG